MFFLWSIGVSSDKINVTEVTDVSKLDYIELNVLFQMPAAV